MKNNIINILFRISIIAIVISFFINILSYAFKNVDFLLPLLILLFVVAAVEAIPLYKIIEDIYNNKNKILYFEYSMRNTPKLMKYGCIILFFYTMSLIIIDYIILKDSNINVIRFFSSGFMTFYLITVCIFYSKLKEKE